MTVHVSTSHSRELRGKGRSRVVPSNITSKVSGKDLISPCFIFPPLIQEKEEEFRQVSEDTNSKVLWWAVVQTSILLSVGFWQMKRLKDFFIAKKLV